MRKILQWTRRIVVGLIACLVFWLLAATVYGRYAAARDHRLYPAPGAFADVGGRRVHVYCIGKGRPTVVLESGLGGPTVLWQQVQPAVAQVTRTCSYDRDGVGWSEESGQPRTARGYSDDLHRAMVGVGEQGPFVIVGHSLGGILAFNYARSYPDDVAGMVLLDPSHPRQFARGSEQWADHNQAMPYFRVAPALAELGLVREAFWAAGALKPLPLPSAARKAYVAVASSPKAMRAMRAEAEALFLVCETSSALPMLADKPLVVLSAERTLAEGFPVAFHDEMASRSTRGARRVVPNASHSGLVLKPESVKAVVAAILEVVEASQRVH